MRYQEITNATLDQLTDELGAAGWYSTLTDVREAREAVARLIQETRGLDLVREDGEVIGRASGDEAAESCHSAEGWILVRTLYGEIKCSVQE